MSGVLLALWLLAPPPPPAPAQWPPEVPRASGWERIAGAGQDGTLHYALCVDPGRPLLYTITWYHIAQAAGDWGRPREILIWNATPGERKPLFCWERIGHRSWRSLWLRKHRRWKRLPPETDAYKAEMMTAIHLYQLH